MFLLYIYYVDKMKKEFDFDFKSGDPYFYYDALSDKHNKKYSQSFYLGYDDLGLFLRNRLAKRYFVPSYIPNSDDFRRLKEDQIKKYLEDYKN